MNSCMRLFKFCTLLSLLALFVAVPSYAFDIYRVVGVADGDTVTVLDADQRQIKVRLYGIDCPEKRQAWGNRATQFTRQAVHGKDVRLDVRSTDRYGRTVAVVYIDGGVTLQEALLEAGLAWVYPQYCKIPECAGWREREHAAMLRSIGLWQDGDAVPPWVWRKQKL